MTNIVVGLYWYDTITVDDWQCEQSSGSHRTIQYNILASSSLSARKL